MSLDELIIDIETDEVEITIDEQLQIDIALQNNPELIVVGTVGFPGPKGDPGEPGAPGGGGGGGLTTETTVLNVVGAVGQVSDTTKIVDLLVPGDPPDWMVLEEDGQTVTLAEDAAYEIMWPFTVQTPSPPFDTVSARINICEGTATREWLYQRTEAANAVILSGLVQYLLPADPSLLPVTPPYSFQLTMSCFVTFDADTWSLLGSTAGVSIKRFPITPVE